MKYPFKHGEVVNYTLDDVSIPPVTTKIQVSFLNQLPERKETAQGFHHDANGDFKTVKELNSSDRRKLRMDQQHCRYSTTLTYMIECNEGSLYRIKIFQNMHPVCIKALK